MRYRLCPRVIGCCRFRHLFRHRFRHRFISLLIGLLGTGALHAAPLAMAPVLPPTSYTFDNRGSPVAFLSPLAASVIAFAQRDRRTALGTLFRARQLALGTEMTDRLREALQAAGIETLLLEHPPRLADDPNTLDHAPLAAQHETVLTAVFDDAGYFSGFTSASFKPRLNVSVYLTRCRDGEVLFTHSVYYGVDARSLSDEGIPADPRYTYSTYDEAMSKPDELVQAMRDGMAQIATVMARQLAKELGPANGGRP